MSDTGQIPGEGLPENAGTVEQPGVAAPADYAYLAPSDYVPEDDDLLLMPSPQGAWSDPQPVPAPGQYPDAAAHASVPAQGGQAAQAVHVQASEESSARPQGSAPVQEPPRAQQPVQAPVPVPAQVPDAYAGQQATAEPLPGTHAQVAGGQGSGPADPGGARVPAPTPPPGAMPQPKAAPRRPLHRGPVAADGPSYGGTPAGGVVRSLADRGPAGAPQPQARPQPQAQAQPQVQPATVAPQAGLPTGGPEYLRTPGDASVLPGPQLGQILPQGGSPWSAPTPQTPQQAAAPVTAEAVAPEAPGGESVAPEAVVPEAVAPAAAPEAPAAEAAPPEAVAPEAAVEPDVEPVAEPAVEPVPVAAFPEQVVAPEAVSAPEPANVPVAEAAPDQAGAPVDAPAEEPVDAAPVDDAAAGAPDAGTVVPAEAEAPSDTAPEPVIESSESESESEPVAEAAESVDVVAVPEHAEAGPAAEAVEGAAPVEVPVPVEQAPAPVAEEAVAAQPEDAAIAVEPVPAEAVEAATTEDTAAPEATQVPEAPQAPQPAQAPEAPQAVENAVPAEDAPAQAAEQSPAQAAEQPVAPTSVPVAEAAAEVPSAGVPEPGAGPEAPGTAAEAPEAGPEAVAAPDASTPAETAPAQAAEQGPEPSVAPASVPAAEPQPGPEGHAGPPAVPQAPVQETPAPVQEAEDPEAPAPDGTGAPATPPAPGYDDAEREAVLRVMRERRDIRNGFRGDPIPHEVLLRVLEAAHTAPSVGHSQPWDFVVIRSAETRRSMHELAQRQRDAYAKSLPKGRAKQFKELKIEAILDTPVNIVVTADPTRGGRHTLGRHTQPQMAPYSSALAVENLWLAARAEGLGVGWVSFFDEREMVRALGLPEHLEVVAYLCVGYVDEFPEEPELMQAGWSKRRPLSWVVHEETYGRRALPGEEPHDLLQETISNIRPLDAKALGEAWERQKRMTKPAGALGMLEIISAQLSGLSRVCPPPVPEPAAVAIFAGDHGVHAQGVTAWPQEVTGQMVANFLGGGAVCNAFAAQVGAEVCVVDVGVAMDLPATPGLLPRKVRAGTADFTAGPALTREEVLAAVEVGIETARDLVAAGNKGLLIGEMGIANTTASAALICVYTGLDPAEVTGRGTGINDEMHARKVDVVRRALELHQPDPADPIGVLAAVGGLEHAAMAGFLLGGASLRTPVILDGVSAGAAALVARAIAPEALAACIAGHRSAEPGHVAALNKLGLRPLVDLDLRLGEGTGALLALPIVQSAARAMHEVATFDAAGVTEK
ncbi:nicotinate-nucleotide--dimethylbenzimidazole phosphoribosyltransferase [Streptomyces sp. NPDC032161]|uniref:nicotinate-nucleotide--dimethylbenzimidazole phosphoribosyltransferase n=1 Tax=unclassified Streptomyces TaxID=2593676 RepID=UPI0033F7EDD1